MNFIICVPFLQQVFHSVAYKAHCREDLLAGIDEFLMQVTYVVSLLSPLRYLDEFENFSISVALS